MQLIGMLDSPFVRRVAISLQMLGLPFEHRSIYLPGAARSVSTSRDPA
jgi:glutathione S-transferase